MLISVAELDLDALRIVRETTVADEIVGFHAQQAAERLFKAWAAALGLMFPLTHDLEILIDLVRDRQAEADRFRDLICLRPLAVRFRYERIGGDPEAVNRGALVSRLEGMVAVIKEALARARLG